MPRTAMWIKQLAALKRLLSDGDLGQFDRTMIQRLGDRSYDAVTKQEKLNIEEAWRRLCG